MDTLLIGLMLIVVAIIVAGGGLFILRRRVALEELQANHEVGGFILGVIAHVYAILLAFVVIVVWGQYKDAATLSTQASASIGGMFWMAEALPDSARQQIQGHLRDYAQAVVTDEWPLLARGQESDTAWAIHDQLWQDMHQLSGQPGIDQAVYLHLLGEMQDVDEKRRLRLASSEERIPGLMWVILIGGGIEAVLFTYAFGTKRVGVQIGMTAALVLLIGLVLLLIAELDTPFSGDLKLEPAGYRSILQMMNQKLGP